MRLKILLLFVAAPFFSAVYGQKNQKLTAFAITGPQKGQGSWNEVRLVDINTGEELKTIYKNSDQVEILNARTGKAVTKKDPATKEFASNTQTLVTSKLVDTKIENKKELERAQVLAQRDLQTTVKDNTRNNAVTKQILIATPRVQYDKPFATTSAACAYDKKHERLYYTPMGINELRYIDLKSGKIFYFENEPFGALKGPHDVANQITRMVIASDGDGYAVTNDGNHLIRFTTGKKPEITDLGPLTDDASNGAFSIHSSGGYGGDVIADTKKNLYLITANRNVFKISLENKVATFSGAIQGLPKGYTTNGAIVEEGSKIIVSSSNSTQGYFRFDLNTLQAEKVSAANAVFNASDLANGNLAFEKRKKEKKTRELQPKDPVQVVDAPDVTPLTQEPAGRTAAIENIQRNNISVYPNPVTNGYVKLSFADQPAGKYQVQFLDISGKLLQSEEVNIMNKIQVEEIRLPAMITKGNYLLKVIGGEGKVSVINKLVVQ